MRERALRPLRRSARALLVLLLGSGVAGCIDSLGVGSDCSAAMLQIRLQEGSPVDSERSEFRGVYTELWIYTSPNRTYEFRWGAGYSECEVDGPNSFSRIPGDRPVF